MIKRKINKTGGQGVIYTYVFEIDLATDHLELKEVLVKGQNIIEVFDPELLQDAYTAQYSQWIMSST